MKLSTLKLWPGDGRLMFIQHNIINWEAKKTKHNCMLYSTPTGYCQAIKEHVLKLGWSSL